MRYFTTSLRIILFFILAVLFLSSCKCVQKSRSDISNTQYPDSICFLVFNINKDSTLNKSNINLISKIKTEGKIKSENQDNINSDNYLTIEVFEAGKLINTITINHPLYKNIEYVDDNNELKSKYIELEKNDFFIRLQQNAASTKIRISESLKNKEKQELIIIKL